MWKITCPCNAYECSTGSQNLTKKWHIVQWLNVHATFPYEGLLTFHLWAHLLFIFECFPLLVKAPLGFEPRISCLLGRRLSQQSYRATLPHMNISFYIMSTFCSLIGNRMFWLCVGYYCLDYWIDILHGLLTIGGFQIYR